MRLKTLARAGDRDELRRRLRAVRPDTQARWGRMSAHQMICHLTDALQMATGQRPVKPTGGWFFRNIVSHLVLWFPLKWPEGVATNPELDQLREGTRPADFAGDMARLESMVDVVSAAARTLDGQAHPLFGRLSARAWKRWGYLHMDHHLRQFGV